MSRPGRLHWGNRTSANSSQGSRLTKGKTSTPRDHRRYTGAIERGVGDETCGGSKLPAFFQRTPSNSKQIITLLASNVYVVFLHIKIHIHMCHGRYYLVFIFWVVSLARELEASSKVLCSLPWLFSLPHAHWLSTLSYAFQSASVLKDSPVVMSNKPLRNHSTSSPHSDMTTDPRHDSRDSHVLYLRSPM